MTQGSDSETKAEIWHGDLMHRQQDAQNILRFLDTRLSMRRARGEAATCVLNLEAGWGYGKTFLMERLARQLRAEGRLVAEINAWKEDFAEDPFIPVLGAIDRVLRNTLAGTAPTGMKGVWDKAAKNATEVRKQAGPLLLAILKGGSSQGLKRLTGLAAEDLLQILSEGRDEKTVEVIKAGLEGATDAGHRQLGELLDRLSAGALAEHEAARSAIEKFCANLADTLAAIEESGGRLPLYVLIDEVDRCRPPYAIALLERVKHIFDIDGVVFVISTNTQQMRSSIKAVYGNEFDAPLYLRRFFDRTYHLARPDHRILVDEWMSPRPDVVQKFDGSAARLAFLLAESFRRAGFDVRSTLQCLDLIEDVATAWSVDICLDAAILVCLAVAQQSGIEPRFDGAIAGELSEICHLSHVIVPAKDGQGYQDFSVLRLLDVAANRLLEGGRPQELADLANIDWNQADPAERHCIAAWGDELRVTRERRGPSLWLKYPDLVRQAGISIGLPDGAFQEVPVSGH